MVAPSELDIKEKLLGVIQHDIEKPWSVNLDVSSGCEALETDNEFHYILLELIHNAAEKQTPDIQIHVTLKYDQKAGEYDLKVENNRMYTPTKAAELMKALNSGETKSVENSAKNYDKNIAAGRGINICRVFISKYSGHFEYQESPDHRIIAHARWKK